MTEANVIEIIKRIGTAGRAVGIPLENIKKATSWATEEYSGLEIGKLAENINHLSRKNYHREVNPEIASEFLLTLGNKEANMKITYGTLAALAFHMTDIDTYGRHVRTHQKEASLFGLPVSSASYLDEAERFFKEFSKPQSVPTVETLRKKSSPTVETFRGDKESWKYARLVYYAHVADITNEEQEKAKKLKKELVRLDKHFGFKPSNF